MGEFKCRHRLPSPGHAGAVDMDTLKRWAAQFPHLRPCPMMGWGWVNKKDCEKCGNKVEGNEKSRQCGVTDG